MSSGDPAGGLAPPPMLLPDNPTSPGNGTAAPPLTDSPPAPGTLLAPPPSGANGSFTAVPPPPSPSVSSNNQVRMALLIGIGIGGLIMLVCVGIFVFWYKRRKRALGSYGFAHASEQGPKGEIFIIVLVKDWIFRFCNCSCAPPWHLTICCTRMYAGINSLLSCRSFH